MEAINEVASILGESIQLLAVEGWLLFGVIKGCEYLNRRDKRWK